MAQLELLNLSVHLGGAKAVQNVSIRMGQGELRGPIGPNGTGKTMVSNTTAGVVQSTVEDVYFEEQRLNGVHADKIVHVGITHAPQNIRIYPKMAAAENVAIGLDSYPSYNVLSAMLRLPRVVKRNRGIKRLSLEYLDRMRILEYKDYEAGALPYGLQKKLEIAYALATKPELLSLDGPATGMGTNESIELISFLKGLHQNSDGLIIVLTEHHLGVVMKVCQGINVLSLGTMLVSGTLDEIQKNPDVIKAYLGERRKRNGKQTKYGEGRKSGGFLWRHTGDPRYFVGDIPGGDDCHY